MLAKLRATGAAACARYLEMFPQTDHPLSKEGIDQAAANRNWQKQYLAVKAG